MTELDAVIAARAHLNHVTPLREDCGRSCQRACCLPNESGQGGMLLFPGEEALYETLPEGFSISDDTSFPGGAKLLLCPGTCVRDARPLSCRFFPLRPTYRGHAVMDKRGTFVCPLIQSGIDGLNQAFVFAAQQAAQTLISVPAHRDFLQRLYQFIKAQYTL